MAHGNREPAKEAAMGFGDYKWFMGWMNDFTNYMRCDPYFQEE